MNINEKNRYSKLQGGTGKTGLNQDFILPDKKKRRT